MSTQLIIGNNSGAVTTTSYAPFSSTRNGSGAFQSAANVENARDICAVPGVLSLFTVRLEFPLTAGSVTFNLLVNGVAVGPTLTFTVGQTFQKDTFNSATLAVYDTITVQAVPSSASPSPRPSFSYVFTPTTADQLWISGGSIVDANLTGTRNYHPMIGGSTWRTTYNQQEAFTVIPINCTLKDFYATCTAAPGVGNTREVSMYLNGAQIAASVATFGAADTQKGVTGMTQALVPGDLISFSHITTGAPTTGKLRWAARIDATTAGESFISGVTAGGYSSAGSQNFIALIGTNQTWLTETFGPSFLMSTLPKYARLSSLYMTTPFAAPGAGQTGQFSLGVASARYLGTGSTRGVARGFLPITFSGASQTTGNNTTDFVDVAPGEPLYFCWYPSSSAATTNAGWAVKVTYPTQPTYMNL